MNGSGSRPFDQRKFSAAATFNRRRSDAGTWSDRDGGNGFFWNFGISCEDDVDDLRSVGAQDVPGFVHGEAAQTLPVDVDDLVAKTESAVAEIIIFGENLHNFYLIFF